MSFELSILVPIYNEINLIEKFTLKLFETFKNYSVKYIFIDDGSIDGSKKWLEKNLKKIIEENDVKLINLKENQGKGHAIRQGIKHIEGDYTVCIDSDLEYDPKDALEIYEIAKKNKNIDVLYGSRYLGGKIQLRKHFLNDIAVRLNTYIFNVLFDQSITDLHTGTKVIKSNLLSKLKLSLNRFGLEIDMSSQIAKKKYNIYEYGISYVERTKGQGKKITFIDGLLSYYFLFKTRFLQNDIYTSVSISYSSISMTYIGTYFGMGLGKIIVVIVFLLIGLMLGINRRILPLSLIFLGIYIGSFFGEGDEKIVYILISFFITFIMSKKISNKLKKHKKNILFKFLI